MTPADMEPIRDWIEAVSPLLDAGSQRRLRLMLRLFAVPATAAEDVMAEFGVSFATAKRDLMAVRRWARRLQIPVGGQSRRTRRTARACDAAGHQAPPDGAKPPLKAH